MKKSPIGVAGELLADWAIGQMHMREEANKPTRYDHMGRSGKLVYFRPKQSAPVAMELVN